MEQPVTQGSHTPHQPAPVENHDTTELLSPLESPRSLRSASHIILAVPRTRLRTVGDRALWSIAPRLWNSLPDNLRMAQSLTAFKAGLKTHFYQCAYPSLFTVWYSLLYFHCVLYYFVLCFYSILYFACFIAAFVKHFEIITDNEKRYINKMYYYYYYYYTVIMADIVRGGLSWSSLIAGAWEPNPSLQIGTTEHL